MLKPNDNWKWFYTQDTQSLMLDLSDEYLYCVSFSHKHLLDQAKQTHSFSIDDAFYYEKYFESVRHLNISGHRHLEVVFNAVAARRFYKPILPKSWFFDRVDEGINPEDGAVVCLGNKFNLGRFLIVENTGEASLCCCIEEYFQLNSTKEIELGHIIKVMNDRMKYLALSIDEVNYAQVG